MRNISTDNQILLLVDEADVFSGQYATRKECHTGNGIHHRAFLVLLENDNKEVLLQKRKHNLWDDFWDITATTHPFHLEDRNETYEEAAKRALQNEMGIKDVKLKNIGGFNYFAKHGDNCENEYCAILVGEYNGEVKASPDLVYHYKWMPKDEFIQECMSSNSSYTPWAILTGKFLKNMLNL